jgi:hypothetical protein
MNSFERGPVGRTATVYLRATIWRHSDVEAVWLPPQGSRRGLVENFGESDSGLGLYYLEARELVLRVVHQRRRSAAAVPPGRGSLVKEERCQRQLLVITLGNNDLPERARKAKSLVRHEPPHGPRNVTEERIVLSQDRATEPNRPPMLGDDTRFPVRQRASPWSIEVEMPGRAVREEEGMASRDRRHPVLTPADRQRSHEVATVVRARLVVLVERLERPGQERVGQPDVALPLRARPRRVGHVIRGVPGKPPGGVHDHTEMQVAELLADAGD